MQTPHIEQVVQKLQALTPNRVNEVENFIDFLQQRDQDKLLRKDYIRASENAFSVIWNNDEDVIYDQL